MLAPFQIDLMQIVHTRRIVLTHLDKVMYPEAGTTKADVLAYYASVAPAIIRHAAKRPATRKRWVHGVGMTENPGTAFFHKDLDEGAPDWMRRREIRHTERVTVYPLVTDLATALAAGDSIDGFVCYDGRLSAAATALGLTVLAPA